MYGGKLVREIYQADVEFDTRATTSRDYQVNGVPLLIRSAVRPLGLGCVSYH